MQLAALTVPEIKLLITSSQAIPQAGINPALSSRSQIAVLCEAAHLHMLALHLHTDPAGITRTIVSNINAIDPDELVHYFGSVSASCDLATLKVGRRIACHFGPNKELLF